MPADHGLGLDDDERALPARPATQQRDPERSIDRGESRPGLPLRVDGELLPQGQLHDGLLLAIPKESEQASGHCHQELEQRSHDERDAARFREEKEA
jgi:hypothetical protein